MSLLYAVTTLCHKVSKIKTTFSSSASDFFLSLKFVKSLNHPSLHFKDHLLLFRTDENKPFAIDRQKPEGAGFYSEGLSYKEFKV